MKTISNQEAKFLVTYYYITQEDRKRFYNQERTLDEVNKSHPILKELAEKAKNTEKEIVRNLNVYTKEHVVGNWIRSVHGLGPMLAAGILSYIDITKVHHAGSIWVYAGINAEAKWNKGEKRPWNKQLKNLSWKIGDSFNKFQNDDKCYYGKIIKERKKQEWEKNLAGENIQQAEINLKTKKFNKDTTAYQWYSGQFNDIIISDKREYRGIVNTEKGDCFPMLPPAHIQARAQRYAVKRFYSDLYVVWYEIHHKKKAPLPYVIVSNRFPEHTHYVEPYNYTSPYT